MNSSKKTARIVGVLFITATVAASISVVLMGSTLSESGYLANIAASENQMIISVMFWLILAVSVFCIGAIMLPILKKQNEAVAIGYFSTRLLESAFIIVSAIALLSMLTLGQEYTAGALDASSKQPLGALLLAIFNWSFIIGTMVFLGLGGLFLNYSLYKSKLVPRWLSVWGLLGATSVLIYGLISFYGLDPSFLAIPIALQEMVFAVWLIVKGFNPSAIEPESA